MYKNRKKITMINILFTKNYRHDLCPFYAEKCAQIKKGNHPYFYLIQGAFLF